MQHHRLETARKTHSINPITKTLLYKRGLDDQGIHELLSWDLGQLPSLTAMKDMDKSAARIVEAILENQKIGIYGDYDVDGTTACALFYHFLRTVGLRRIELMQPSRFVDGYGIHPPGIDLARQKGIDLLITVDCGITGHEAASRAVALGIDLIVTDHHSDTAGRLPEAYAVVNPNRQDEPSDSPLKHLSGVGVAFAVCLKVKETLEQRARQVPSIYPLLQFVAIGTVCDLVKLTPMNLKLVRHGMKQMPTTQYLGIRSFFTPDERQKSLVASEKLSFHIGPMLNSKGRIDHPERALKLLIVDNNTEAYEHFSHLEACNYERKRLQGEVFREAKQQIADAMAHDGHAISIAYKNTWHEGVVGIVASRLVEIFKVPAVVFTDSSEDGIIKASVRSAGGYDIFSALKECEELFVKFGGHRAAAGLSMHRKNLPRFEERINAILLRSPEAERVVQESYDIEISALDISMGLIKSLELLEPFGPGNPRPVFKMSDVRLHSFDILKDVHVRWTFKTSLSNKTLYHKGISFNYLNGWKAIHPENIFLNQHNLELNVYFTLGLNLFNGRQYIQLNVKKITID